MKVGESHADLDLRITAQKRGLLRQTDKALIMPTNTVIVFKDEGYSLVDKYSFTLAMAEKHEFTIPDLIVLQFLDAPAIDTHSRMITDVVPFYLDWRRVAVSVWFYASADQRCIYAFIPFFYAFLFVWWAVSKRLLKQICDEIEELMT